MASIRKEIIIEAQPEQVWSAIRDVGAVHRRLVPGYTADTRIEGANRTLILADGGIVRELIVAVDDEERRMAYAVIEARMQLEHHHASFQVYEESDGRSRLIWITDFLPHEYAAEIRIRVNRGAEIMKQTIEAEARLGSSSE